MDSTDFGIAEFFFGDRFNRCGWLVDVFGRFFFYLNLFITVCSNEKGGVLRSLEHTLPILGLRIYLIWLASLLVLSSSWSGGLICKHFSKSAATGDC